MVKKNMVSGIRLRFPKKTNPLTDGSYNLERQINPGQTRKTGRIHPIINQQSHVNLGFVDTTVSPSSAAK